MREGRRELRISLRRGGRGSGSGEHARCRGDHDDAAHEGRTLNSIASMVTLTAVGMLESITASFVESSSRFNR